MGKCVRSKVMAQTLPETGRIPETRELMMDMAVVDDEVTCESMHLPFTCESGTESVLGLTPTMMSLESFRR